MTGFAIVFEVNDVTSSRRLPAPVGVTVFRPRDRRQSCGPMPPLKPFAALVTDTAAV